MLIKQNLELTPVERRETDSTEKLKLLASYAKSANRQTLTHVHSLDS